MTVDYPVMQCDVLVVVAEVPVPWPDPRQEVRPDQEVIVLEKGDAKYSGCIARGMDALNIVAVPGVAFLSCMWNPMPSPVKV